jgi:hypothetical protein
MNRTLTIVLLTGTLTMHVDAKRKSEADKAGTPESSGVSSGITTETSPAPARTAPRYSVRTPSTPTPASTFVAPATPRTYTPSAPVYRGESYKGRSERNSSEAVQQNTPTRAEAPVTSPLTAPQRERKTTVTTEPVRVETARDTEQTRSRVQRERKPATPETLTEPAAAQPAATTRVRSTRERQTSDQQPVTQTEPKRERTSQRSTDYSNRERTARPDDSQRVQIKAPTRTPSRTPEKEASPVLFNESAPQPTTPAQKAIYSRREHPQYEVTAQRRPEPSRTYHHEPDRRSYYDHHYPAYHHTYRPVTCYSRRDAFWDAFAFTLAAPFVAPLFVASPFVAYPTRSVTTTWGNEHVSFSVSTRSTYPVYTYRPYYCTSSWYYHDGWQHSHVYYGGWRSSWYGGFSYMFNPYPVYRTYYLYEEPQTVVIQQPAQQVIIYNQPAQPAVVQNQNFVAAPAPATPAPQTPATVARNEENAATAQTERCLCACKCNGKVPCICEYACGSEFAYSPEAYTLGGFVSYSESLNTELIWSSYAGLDRPETSDFIAEAWEQ